MLLKDRVAVITGASRGIGAATAKILALHGAAVGVNYCASDAAAVGVVHDIEKSGGRALAVQNDVRDREQVEAMVARVTAELGAIDTVVLNASITFPMVSFLEYDWEAF